LFGIHFSPLSKKILALFESPEIEPKIIAKDFRILAFVIVCGSVVAPLLLLNGLNQTTAVNTSLLLNAESLFTALIAFVFLSERGNKKEYFGIAMLLLGVVFVTTNGEFQTTLMPLELPARGRSHPTMPDPLMFWKHT